jgi:hypothetical protein
MDQMQAGVRRYAMGSLSLTNVVTPFMHYYRTYSRVQEGPWTFVSTGSVHPNIAEAREVSVSRLPS